MKQVHLLVGVKHTFLLLVVLSVPLVVQYIVNGMCSILLWGHCTVPVPCHWSVFSSCHYTTGVLRPSSLLELITSKVQFCTSALLSKRLVTMGWVHNVNYRGRHCEHFCMHICLSSRWGERTGLKYRKLCYLPKQPHSLTVSITLKHVKHKEHPDPFKQHHHFSISMHCCLCIQLYYMHIPSLKSDYCWYRSHTCPNLAGMC